MTATSSNQFAVTDWRRDGGTHWHLYVTEGPDPGPRAARALRAPDGRVFSPEDVAEAVYTHALLNGPHTAGLVDDGETVTTFDPDHCAHLAGLAACAAERGDSFYSTHGRFHVYAEARPGSDECQCLPKPRRPLDGGGSGK